jgi:hypothetical protein
VGVTSEMKSSESAMAFTNEVVDPKVLEQQERLGLNKRQLFLLDKSWKNVTRSLTECGVEMMILCVDLSSKHSLRVLAAVTRFPKHSLFVLRFACSVSGSHLVFPHQLLDILAFSD